MGMVRAVYPDLAGKAVLITGGAAGIGRAMAEAFAAQGAQVGILDVSAEAIASLRAAFPAIEAEEVDLRDIAATQAAIARLTQRIGAPHILVNNAAHDARHALETLTPEYWDDRMAVNLRHVMFVTQAVLPAMRKAGRGVILSLGSNSWMKASTGMIAYTTAKSAIQGFTRSLSREVGAEGIRVNSIAPGWVMTERQITHHSTPEKRAGNLAAQGLKREIEPDDIAHAALFLCSEASSMITGQTLIVDGGITFG